MTFIDILMLVLFLFFGASFVCHVVFTIQNEYHRPWVTNKDKGDEPLIIGLGFLAYGIPVVLTGSWLFYSWYSR